MNPNPRIFQPHHHHHHITAAAPASVSTQPPDLHTTLSTLKHLIYLSKTSIQSLSTILPTTATTTTTTTAATCPFNSNHRLPPTSLFHHHLHCPNSLAPINLTNHNDSNFFYRDCPSVVTFQNQNNNENKSIPTLPDVLLAGCDNNINVQLDSYSVELLPSEYYNLRKEITQWNDYPLFYSFSIIRSIIYCYIYISSKDSLTEWIIMNSPFYGVVIDVIISDHILLLVRFCLKAIAREAIGYLVSVSESGVCNFQCPVLGKVFGWLGEQLGILYGEINGKLFAINILKQSLVASSKSLFSFDEVNGKTVNEKDGSKTGTILASQVEAAVSALHEQFVLETRIKALRGSRFVPAYQRVQEHEYLSKKANEERSKRSNYRPIIEHDGVLWHRGGNQDGNKNKSQEELLAEERDYKRRRMSYRGKKMKRSTTQVTRDIIDEYMEEIKHANLASEPSSRSDIHAYNETVTSSNNSSKSNKTVPQSHLKQSVSDISKEKRQDGHKGNSRSHDHENRDEQKRSKRYHFSSPDRSHSRSHDNHQRSKHKDKRSFEDRYDPSKSGNMDDDDGL